MERLAKAELIGVGRRLRSTAPVELDAKTAELAVRVRPTAATKATIVVDVDGELYRAEAEWPAGPYIAKDFGIWSLDGGAPSTPTTAPEPTSTSTPLPTATPTSTAIPTATATAPPTFTPEPTATPVAPTSTPISPTVAPTATATPTATWECQIRVRERLNGGSWVTKWVSADPSECGR